MGVVILKNVKVAVKKETTEGTYIAPASGADYIQAQEDAIEMNGSKETLELNVIGLGLSNAAPRVGLESATGSIGVYMKAASTATVEPEWGILLESMLGAKRSMTAALTSGTTHSTTVINVSDTSDLKVGDSEVIKESGDFHTSTIISIVTNNSLTMSIRSSILAKISAV